ncbi:MAG: hypothetical protein IPH82_22490 [Chloroflexi bacterium]|nr:hypothetical protein [Chloroflexota bacterium]
MRKRRRPFPQSTHHHYNRPSNGPAETAEPIEKAAEPNLTSQTCRATAAERTDYPQIESSPLQPAVQRAIAAAETAEPIEKAETAVPPTESSPLQPAVQRAIAAAETAEPTEKAETPFLQSTHRHHNRPSN